MCFLQLSGSSYHSSAEHQVQRERQSCYQSINHLSGVCWSILKIVIVGCGHRIFLEKVFYQWKRFISRGHVKILRTGKLNSLKNRLKRDKVIFRGYTELVSCTRNFFVPMIVNLFEKVRIYFTQVERGMINQQLLCSLYLLINQCTP